MFCYILLHKLAIKNRGGDPGLLLLDLLLNLLRMNYLSFFGRPAFKGIRPASAARNWVTLN